MGDGGRSEKEREYICTQSQNQRNGGKIEPACSNTRQDGKYKGQDKTPDM
jgi:hypothetical protein